MYHQLGPATAALAATATQPTDNVYDKRHTGVPDLIDAGPVDTANTVTANTVTAASPASTYSAAAVTATEATYRVLGQAAHRQQADPAYATLTGSSEAPTAGQQHAYGTLGAAPASDDQYARLGGGCNDVVLLSGSVLFAIPMTVQPTHAEVGDNSSSV